MSKYYILIIEEIIKAFSVVGHGNECLFTFVAKEQTTPFDILEDGDKIIGYISNEEKRFAYIFEAKKINSENECQLVKCYESAGGPTIDEVSENIKTVIYENENNKSFIAISEKNYNEIINLMIEMCKKEYVSNGYSKLSNSKYSSNLDLEKNRIKFGTNVLLYGVPGSGKSWTIEHEYCDNDTNVERVVFHPDYTYSDFIGQILPNVDDKGKVSYEFTSGPFTNILIDAYANPKKKYILVIEEINRGNAPAIFGEVFQLLDRKKEVKENDDGYPIGTSEYGITNANIAEKVYGDKNQKVRIPSNLSIIGTMNTSDQNVFTLDTAFQRRWEMRLIENDFKHVERKFSKMEILDTGITWKAFCTQINKIIVGNNARLTSSEDKRLGVYFIHMNDLEYNSKMGNLDSGEYDDLCSKEREKKITQIEKIKLEEIRAAMRHNRKFPEKVIKYLWDDAFKFNREIIFKTSEYQSLEEVIHKFMYSENKERFAIFNDNVRDAFSNPQS